MSLTNTLLHLHFHYYSLSITSIMEGGSYRTISTQIVGTICFRYVVVVVVVVVVVILYMISCFITTLWDILRPLSLSLSLSLSFLTYHYLRLLLLLLLFSL